MENILHQIPQLLQSYTSFVLTIVVDVRGSTPRKSGTKMIVFPDGKIMGTIGGGSLEKEVTEKAMDVLKNGKPLLQVFNLKEDLGMQCGGEATVYFEPILANPRLFIFGAGHVGREVGRYAHDVGFDVHFIDPRPNIFDQFDASYAHTHPADFVEFADTTPFSENDYLVVTTPSHQYDEILAHKLGKLNTAYLGVIASKRKAALIRENALKQNLLTAEQAQKIDMPMGIPFNAQTPREIAISIVGRLIDIKNSRNHG